MKQIVFYKEVDMTLRLLPYYPELNPIELISISLKDFIAQRNVNLNFNDNDTFVMNSIKKISTEDANTIINV